MDRSDRETVIVAHLRDSLLATRDALAPILERWRADPADREALAGVRAEFLVLQAATAHLGAARVAELTRPVSNLLDRLREGTLGPSADAVALVGDATAWLDDFAALADGIGTFDGSRFGALVERIDAFASGLAELDFDRCETLPVTPNEPPLLTVRDDGARVTPGSFDSEPSADALAQGLLPVVEALQAVVDRFRTQLESLEAVAQDTPGTGGKLRRLAGALYGTADQIERLKDTLSGLER